MRAAHFQESASNPRMPDKNHRTVNRERPNLPCAGFRRRPAGRGEENPCIAFVSAQNWREAGVLPGGAVVLAPTGWLRANPLNLAGPVPVKGVRHQHTRLNTI